MDVSGWDIESRLKLPDHLFGNRKLIGCSVDATDEEDRDWAISEIALPDPVCIWQVRLDSMPNAGAQGLARVGLANTVPTSTADMDAAVELLPYYGHPNVGPNLIVLYTGAAFSLQMDLRKGMATGGKKLVCEIYTVGGTMRFYPAVLVSGLPTKIPGWPGAWPAG
jgi:hypothetical protein